MEHTLRTLYNYYTAVYRNRNTEVEQNYKYNFEKYILQYFGDREISSITPSEIQLALNRMNGKSQTTIRSVVGDLKLIIRHSYIDGYICMDFSPYLANPKHMRGGMRRALTKEERATVIAVAQTQRKYYAYLFMILCGARPSEAFAIEKEDIDFEKQTVHIKGTKTALSDRVVPCPTVILTIAEKSLCGLLCASQSGMKVNKEMQRRIWHSFFIDCHRYMGGSIYRNAPIEPYPFGKDLTAYNLRHEYCTELARNGVDIRITQRLMGHSSLDMTMNVYTNLSAEDIDTELVREIINKK